MKTTISDLELWLGIKNADVKAFSMLMDRYWPILFNKASCRINDADVAKDMVQEVLISIWIKRDKLPSEVLPKAYLYSALKYKILNYVSHSNMRLANANQILENKQAENNLTPEDVMDIKELKSLIKKSTSLMTSNMKEVFELSYVDGLSIAEIADKKNLSVQSVKNYLQEAKGILKKRLSSYLNPETVAGVLVVVLMKG